MVLGREPSRRLWVVARCLRSSGASAAAVSEMATHAGLTRRAASTLVAKHRRRLRSVDCTLEWLLACIEPVRLEDYPLASTITEGVVIYDRSELAPASGDGELLAGSDFVAALEDEIMTAFSDGPGIIVIKNAISPEAIDRVSVAFAELLAQERASGVAAGDHFGEPGANSRMWNSIEKLAVHDPEGFARYFANDVVPLVARAWLGPAYQVSSQLNIVHPGGVAQTPHRDYHLGFMTSAQKERYPAHVHAFSSMLTLQGAIAHCDMPVESGPTTYLPHSHKMQGGAQNASFLQPFGTRNDHFTKTGSGQTYETLRNESACVLFCTGYLAYELPEFADYYQENYVQLPLQKGDCAFFNPALFHAAGKEEPPLFAPFYSNN